jgi:nucleotide-binding universal stress UspA family protein
MKKVLIAVDDTKGSKEAVNVFLNVYDCMRPETVVLLHVQKPEGRTLIDEMLGEPELATLKEVLKGTEVQDVLDRKAQVILNSCRAILEERDVRGIKAVVKFGHPTEAILATAKEEGVEMIIMGSRGKRTHGFLMGSVSREVANSCEIPVLIAK